MVSAGVYLGAGKWGEKTPRPWLLHAVPTCGHSTGTHPRPLNLARDKVFLNLDFRSDSVWLHPLRCALVRKSTICEPLREEIPRTSQLAAPLWFQFSLCIYLESHNWGCLSRDIWHAYFVCRLPSCMRLSPRLHRARGVHCTSCMRVLEGLIGIIQLWLSALMGQAKPGTSPPMQKENMRLIRVPKKAIS